MNVSIYIKKVCYMYIYIHTFTICCKLMFSYRSMLQILLEAPFLR